MRWQTKYHYPKVVPVLKSGLLAWLEEDKEVALHSSSDSPARLMLLALKPGTREGVDSVTEGRTGAGRVHVGGMLCLLCPTNLDTPSMQIRHRSREDLERYTHTPTRHQPVINSTYGFVWTRRHRHWYSARYKPNHTHYTYTSKYLNDQFPNFNPDATTLRTHQG
ncbi:hypothetical protein P691DRAFT_297404 [Macrolepiota fuliginosa MF-IS2]|uniref:Uncharacterized protein n=1 Tax=Macrolepiota fuliginosa MF-IS2 TaxID=1400762 RepID=A0A9P6C139_9AGAR|nr:hypothetical protein P691DRAFT_297404 [Macrolepiota fuliginosa MF-IS2]